MMNIMADCLVLPDLAMRHPLIIKQNKTDIKSCLVLSHQWVFNLESGESHILSLSCAVFWIRTSF